MTTLGHVDHTGANQTTWDMRDWGYLMTTLGWGLPNDYPGMRTTLRLQNDYPWMRTTLGLPNDYPGIWGPHWGYQIDTTQRIPWNEDHTGTTQRLPWDEDWGYPMTTLGYEGNTEDTQWLPWDMRITLRLPNDYPGMRTTVTTQWLPWDEDHTLTT